VTVIFIDLAVNINTFVMKRAFVISSIFLLGTYLPSTAQWTTSGTNIYNSNTGNVGIGTSTPGSKLGVNGVITTTGGLISYGVTGAIMPGNLSAYLLGPSTGDANVIIQGHAGSDVAFWLTGTTHYLEIGGQGGSEASQGAINIDYTGHVGINTLNTSGYNFNVNGTAVFDQVTVKVFSANRPNSTPWADYVFDRNYQLPSIYSLSDYINANRHLPGIPTTAEVERDGLDLGATQAKLLEKIEQLTLYTIQLQKQVDSLKEANDRYADLQRQIDEIKATMLKH
jgi:hypothetical protein